MLITPENSLIAIAADLEFPHFAEILTGWRVVKTGIGKLNAATAILAESYAEPFDVLINLGSVGTNSDLFGVGDIVQATQLIERDNPFSAGVIELPKLQSPELPYAVVGTGDNFVESESLPSPEIQLVDMEAYAFARIARALDMECLVLKVISDSCTSFADWEKNVGPNSKKLANFFKANKFEI
jgi:nucleoside phosphorylase